MSKYPQLPIVHPSLESGDTGKRSIMKPSFVSPIIERVAKKLGLRVEVEPPYRYVGQITTPSGAKRYFRNTNFDLNPLGASEIARDKAYASHFMRLMGYPLAKEGVFFTKKWCKVVGSRRGPEAAYRFARKLGFPVIVKPNSKSQGSGVCKVHNKRELMRAIRSFERRETVFLVQELVRGNDYRIVVLDDEIISAYQRLPLSVTGNGRLTVYQLLREKQMKFKKIGRDTVIKMDDFRIDDTLRWLGLSRNSVLAHGERIELLANANLSTGGDALDVTREMHPKWKRLAVRLTKDMGLRYCGVDVMVQGTLSDKPDQFIVIEINAAPGLDNYASLGGNQQKIVEGMYRKVVQAMMR